jgi:hypothetical protein
MDMFDTKNVTIANCRFFTGDDCLAGRYWENVTVSNCVLNTSCNGFRVGGHNVSINNCLIYGPGEYEHRSGHRHNLESGFQILPQRETKSNKVVTPGPADDIVLSNVTMSNVRSPVWVAYSADAPYSEHNLGVGRIIFNNLTVTGAGKTPFYISAPPDNPARSIVLNNVRMTFEGGADEDQAEGQAFSPYSILQSYGIYCRNVEHLELHDLRLAYREKDRRPALMGENIGTLELDRFVAQREPDGAPSLLFAGINKLLIDGRLEGIAKLAFRGLDSPSSAVLAGEPFAVAVSVENIGPDGLGEVPLRMGSKTAARSVWLKSGENADVHFVNMITSAVGQLPVECPGLSRRLSVSAKRLRRNVSPPYRAFRNTEGEVQEVDGGFYIQAGADTALLDYADQYAAAFLPGALSSDSVAITKVENPELEEGWSGRTGIMVRNDISKPGQAAGYLILAASPSNGYSMEWDSNGDGRIDRHTEFDGYTYWPHWLKLERRGNKFIGFSSSDGKTWQLVGETEITTSAPKQDVGVFAHASSARFTDLKVSKAGP